MVSWPYGMPSQIGLDIARREGLSLHAVQQEVH